MLRRSPLPRRAASGGRYSTLRRSGKIKRGNYTLRKTAAPGRWWSTLKYQSPKKRRETPARRRCIALVRLRSGGICEFPGCCRPSKHVHEKLMRSHCGSVTDPANCMDVCWSHHRQIHRHPAASYAAGWLIKGNTVQEVA